MYRTIYIYRLDDLANPDYIGDNMVLMMRVVFVFQVFVFQVFPELLVFRPAGDDGGVVF